MLTHLSHPNLRISINPSSDWPQQEEYQIIMRERVSLFYVRKLWDPQVQVHAVQVSQHRVMSTTKLYSTSHRDDIIKSKFPFQYFMSVHSAHFKFAKAKEKSGVKR